MELKASHILLKTEKEANEIIKSLSSAKDKKAAFTKLAKEKSNWTFWTKTVENLVGLQKIKCYQNLVQQQKN